MTPEKTQAPIRYPSDLIDEEWEILQPIFDELKPYTTGRLRTTDLREILNAIFYLNKTGCPLNKALNSGRLGRRCSFGSQLTHTLSVVESIRTG